MEQDLRDIRMDDDQNKPKGIAQYAAGRARVRRLRDPVAIVREALADPSLFKEATTSLDACESDERAAQVLVDAHDRGEAPSWLVACLLGRVRHRAGYAKVLEILRRGDRALSESYAAGSALQIAGPSAEPDLTDVIDTVEDGTVRKAAAWALGRIASQSAIAFLTGAPARGRLYARTVATALTKAPVEPLSMLEALRSPDPETRRWPPMLIAERLRSPVSDAARAELARCGASQPLREALAAIIEEPDEVVWSADANAIRGWLASLP